MGLKDEEWNELLTAIEEKKCTPFIGAGASSQWIPLGRNISNKWAKEYGYPLEDSHELPRVAEFLAIKRDYDLAPKKTLSLELRKINPPNFALEALRNTSHAVLADLNLPVYITTNYDQFLEAALQSRGRKPITEFCRWSKELNKFVEKLGIPSIFDKRSSKISLSEDRPIVYHLHGVNHLKDINIDTPQSMVLTERDYIDFVININKEERQSNLLPPIIQRAPLTTTLLFIGYGLEDLNFRVIFQGVINLEAYEFRQKSIAVQLQSGFNQQNKEKAQKYLDSYTKDMYKIAVYWGDPLEFATELRRRLDDFRRAGS